MTDLGSAPISRRRALGMFGHGAGILAVVGSGYLTWHAVDQGVFSTGSGPAYSSWNSWESGGRQTSDLIGAAVLAASAHNTQPWLFHVTDRRIDLFADTSRGLGSVDPFGREMYISLGCALENLTVAASRHGLSARVVSLFDPDHSSHVARVDLTPASVAMSPLCRVIGRRHTNRAAYTGSSRLDAMAYDSLAVLADEGVQVVWWTGARQRETFGSLTIDATKAIIADPQQSKDDYAWYRGDWDAIQSDKDGITIDASGQGPLIRTLSKIVPVSHKQSNAGWLRATKDTQVPTAAAFGALIVNGPIDRRAFVMAGRVWQRIHLTATVRGLAMQPLCQVPERIDRERSKGLSPRFGNDLAALLPSGAHAVMTFRIGYPTAKPQLSPRRPVQDVVLSS